MTGEGANQVTSSSTRVMMWREKKKVEQTFQATCFKKKKKKHKLNKCKQSYKCIKCCISISAYRTWNRTRIIK